MESINRFVEGQRDQVSMCVKRILMVSGFLALCACQNLPGAKKPAKPSPETTASKAESSAPFVAMPNPYEEKKVSVSGQAKSEFSRAKAAMKEKQWQKAEGILLLMTQTYPKLSGPYVNLAIAYREQKKVKEAENALNFAIGLNSTNMDAYTILGALYREQGKFEDAERTYLTALEVWPHHNASNRNLGVLYDLYMGRFNEALKYYEMSQRISGGADKELKGWIVDLKRRVAQADKGK